MTGPFTEFEHSGWEGIPEPYHRAFGELTMQAIPALLDAIELKKDMSFLDIASGPGYVAAAAARRGAKVVGIDFSASMVAHARALQPGIDFRQGDAERLSFDDAVFDAAAMNYGILHLAEPAQALAEACRVLRRGGRFAFSAWANPEETIGFGIVLRAVQAHGQMRVSLPEGPPFFHYSDPNECGRALRAAGFDSPRTVKISQIWRLPGGDGLFEAMKNSTVRTAGLLRAQEPAALMRIREAIRSEVAPYTQGAMVRLPMPALIASAVKPET